MWETGRYGRADPILDGSLALLLGALPVPQAVFSELISQRDANHYSYANQRATAAVDSLGLKVQKPGCDGIPDCLETQARKSCCQCHDLCYRRFDCNAIRAWTRTVLRIVTGNPFLRGRCVECNVRVAVCFGLTASPGLLGVVSNQLSLPCELPPDPFLFEPRPGETR